MSAPVNPSSIFVIIPAYNEGAIIHSVLQKVLPYGYSVVVVDDGSRQDLYAAVKDLPIHFLRHRVNLGQGAALQTGIEYALAKGAEYIVTFDGDGQHEAGDIPKFIDALASGNGDIILGSRFMEEAVHNMSARRRRTLQAARYINYLFTGLLLSDAHNGFRAMNRKAAGSIRIHENRMAHATEILAQVKHQRLRYRELPVHVQYTAYSRAKGQTVWSSFRILFDLLLAKLFG
jgi:polyprenyl-phospho-N-acetylgalactosaminyl synthase